MADSHSGRQMALSKKSKKMKEEFRSPARPGVHVKRSLMYAGFLPRFLAELIDSFILLIIIFAPVYAFTHFISERNAGDFMLIQLVWGIIVTWLYNAGFESSGYRATPGKLLLGMQVLDEQGLKISFFQGTVRYIFKYSPLVSTINYLCCLPGLYGILDVGFMFFSNEAQCLHDRIAHTVVVFSQNNQPDNEPADERGEEWEKKLEELDRENDAGL